MALIKCPECGHEVSDKAESCPNCGYKITEAKDEAPTQEQNNGKKIALGIILLAIFISLFVVTKRVDVLIVGALLTMAFSALSKKNRRDFMKICSKCGYQGGDTDNYCPKCAGVMKNANDMYSGVLKNEEQQKNEIPSKFSFAVKLVVGILALISISFYKLGGISCVIFGILGGIISISMCAWKNKLSGIIPAILFLIAAVSAGKHPLTQLVCIIYAGFEIIASIKMRKN